MKTVIHSGEVHLEEEVIQNGYIIVENNCITKINNFSNSNLNQQQLEALLNSEKPDRWIDATRRIIAPGSIEMHTNGFNGVDFVNISEDNSVDLEKILAEYPKYGVTAVSLTLITNPIENVKKSLASILYCFGNRKTRGAVLLPCYLECRYFNDGPTKGAHNPDELVNDANKYKEKYQLKNDDRNLTQIILDEIAELDAVAKRFINTILIDPSLENSGEIIKKLVGKGYKVAIGHSDCTIEEAKKAIDNRATILTHAFNCISMVKDYQGDRILKNPNTKNGLGVCLDDDRVFAEIVLDFVHSNEDYAKMLIDRKGVNHTVLITDACSAAGTQGKECSLGEKKVIIQEKNGNKAAYYEDDTLCSSVLTMDQAIKNAVRLGYSLNESFRMSSSNPAKAIGIYEQRGSIEEGKYADIVIYEKVYDDNTWNIGRVLCTLVEGNIVFSSNDFSQRIERRELSNV